MAEVDSDSNSPLGDVSLDQIPSGGSSGQVDIVPVWMEKLAKGSLSCAHFKEYWRQHVPRIYCPEPNCNCLHLTYDEEKAQRIMFDPLERFICNGNPQEVFQSLSQMSDPPSLCGRVFKMGEPTYCCRDCGMDPTCVLCVDCFKNSTHRQHRYKMSTSQGGGYCDCGDPEAWKIDYCCSRHLTGPTSTGEVESNCLPPDVSNRARAVFSNALKYAFQLLTSEHTMSLPSDLQLKDSDKGSLDLDDMNDTYCTVLYNDESHTFELVINTLCRAIECSQKDAIDFATMIDREGRSLVRCSTYQNCSQVKNMIERQTSRHNAKPLKVLVIHSHVLAHQTFALRLLAWLQKILAHSEGFRALFSEIMMAADSRDMSVLEGILIRDTQLWKAVRNHWHHLFITGMLMEYETKKAFARVFTKKYVELMKDFILDDHDHSFSVTSLSVQIFTVPTLAHYLIAEEDVLTHLLRTFLSECERKRNESGKLEFDRGSGGNTFRRAQYVLYDLKYLLSSKPEQWTPALKKGFLQGFTLLLNLLSWMQGMDSVVRQVGQHMEFEPEWESAFTLHIRLASVISLMLEWCGTNKTVLWNAYKSTLKKLQDCHGAEMTRPGVVRELADHSVACVEYDVSSKPVSVHLPLSRLLGGLHLHLERHSLSFETLAQNSDRPTPEQIIEPVLRTQVMIAQVHAGMWRRNGYSLLNQLYFYHNVKCRSEMLDRDVVVLQMGSALVESNEFLVHLLNKFGLMNWAQPDFETASLRSSSEEDSVRQVVTLVEELLRLLIRVIGERWVPGVGKVAEDDRIKQEIIQLLCIEPMSHSALNKNIPEDANHETGMERVVGEVAVFKKPGHGNGKGVYELRPEMASQYNLFFYHYTREEQSKSEEAQRKRRKAAGELECCPPPPLPPFTDSFKMVANLLQCDVMLYLMRVVLQRANNLRARSFSEVQFHSVLHLTGYALQEEERQRGEEAESGVPQFVVFTERAERWGIPPLLEDLVGSMRVDSCKDLLSWVLKKYRQVSAARTAAQEESSSKVDVVPMDTTESRLQEEDEAIRKERVVKAEMAEARRAKIMAQMTAMQKTFMKENAKLFEAAQKELGAASSVGGGSAMDISESGCDTPVALGPNQTPRQAVDKCHTCILCQEDEGVSATGRSLVLAAYVQRSTVLCKSRSKLMEQSEEVKGKGGGAGGSSGGEKGKKDGAAQVCSNPLFLPADLYRGTLTSTCGHVMHSDCWQKYFDNVLAKERRRPYRLRQPLSFDIEKQEYLCPLCECLSNTVLPLIPPLGQLGEHTTAAGPHVSFREWLEGLQICLKYKKQLTQPQSDLTSPKEEDGEKQAKSSKVEPEDSPTIRFYTCPLAQVAREMGSGADAFQSLFPVEDDGFDESVPQSTLSDNLVEMLNLYSQATYTMGLGVNPHLEDERVPLMAWQSCAYTLRANEWLLREEGKPLLGHLSSRQQDCLLGIIRCAGVLGRACGGVQSRVGQQARGVQLPRVQPRVLASHALRLLTILLNNGQGAYTAANRQPGVCLLHWDPLGMLIPMLMTLPSLFSSTAPPPFPRGSTQDLHVLRLVLSGHLVQLALTSEFDALAMETEETEEAEEEEGVPTEGAHGDSQGAVDALARIREAAGIPAQPMELKDRQVWTALTESARPFLRCCALFFHFLTGVPASKDLQEPGGDTFGKLCRYLGLPQGCQQLLGGPVSELVTSWAAHPRVKEAITEKSLSTLSIAGRPTEPNRLVSLPSDYSELINSVSLFTCPNSDGEDSRTPTMCLVCGEMLCSQSYCCQYELEGQLVGACTHHAHYCGAGVGIFLRVRECKVLLMAGRTKGCFVSPPYLDDYGETDQGLRRGNPLHLCPERYRKLQRMWLGHRIPEEIAHAVESSANVVSTEWYHL